MNLNFPELAAVGRYKNSSQKIRVLSEAWAERNLFCPVCGNPHLGHYGANRPVADFFCENCNSDFELKSKRGDLGKKISDGAYGAMISRVNSNRNPNFFFLSYLENRVRDLLFVPNYFFTPSNIEKRNPLSQTARRAGWVGCNINISKIPSAGKIRIVSDGNSAGVAGVLASAARAKNLFIGNVGARGWLLDVLRCLEKIEGGEFSIDQVYGFSGHLKSLHPQNNFVREKIRQQLQILRDRGLLRFKSRGKYELVAV